MKAKRTATSKASGKRLSLSKADLLRMLIDHEELSVDHVLSLTRMTRAELRAEIRRVQRVTRRQSRAKCPKGHKPNDPACSLTCFIVTIEPIGEMTFLTQADPSKQAMHSWVTDDLKPVYTARSLTEIISKRENLRVLLDVIREHPLEDSVNWQAFASMWRSLNEQFAAPKREWWERIPYSWGWWWRVPYGWLLRWWKRTLLNPRNMK